MRQADLKPLLDALPQDRVFTMWDLGGYGTSTCYAFSRDGLAWEKPELDVRKGTNIVQP